MAPGRYGQLLTLASNFHKLCSIQTLSPSARRLPGFTTSLGVRCEHQRFLQERDESRDVIQKVNDQIHAGTHGRLFAVIQVAGKQYKVTDEDLVVVDGFWPPSPGDRIRLEKVLLVGGSDFTLVGRPLLPKDQVRVLATVIEKNLSPTLMNFRMIRRKRYRKTKLLKIEQTFLRITSIEIRAGVDEGGCVDGIEDRIF